MKSTQYVAPYNMPVTTAYLQCNDALCAASDAAEGFSLVPSQTSDGRVLPAETHEGSGNAYRFTQHPLPSPSVDQRAKAFSAFEARSIFVADLIKVMALTVNEFGTIMETDAAKLAQFYDAIDQYDADCKANQAAHDADRSAAEADANQGHQALHDDE